jgi:hypothetical protein
MSEIGQGTHYYSSILKKVEVDSHATSIYITPHSDVLVLELT